MQEHGVGVNFSCNCLNRKDGVIRDELFHDFEWLLVWLLSYCRVSMEHLEVGRFFVATTSDR
jgi:hypothetical protein